MGGLIRSSTVWGLIIASLVRYFVLDLVVQSDDFPDARGSAQGCRCGPLKSPRRGYPQNNEHVSVG